MKIVKLTSENVLRLNAVEIEPSGNLVVIGGDNGEGKTSVLDSIMLVLAGRQAKHPEPLHRGAEKGKVTLNLGEFIATRTFTSGGGGTLTVTSADGAAKYTSPQKMLDALASQLSFDPLAWSNMDAAKQTAVLKKLVGLDFTQLDQEWQLLYDERTQTNRELKQAEARLEGMGPTDPNAPAEEVSAANLGEQIKAAMKMNQANDAQRRVLDTRKSVLAEKQARLESLRLAVIQAEADVREVEQAVVTQTAVVAGLVDADVDSIQAEMTKIEDTNRRVRHNAARQALEAETNGYRVAATKLSSDLLGIAAQKALMLAEAKFPVEGLSFDDSGVTYNGIPFSQASSAEQLRVSVAMGIALNPNLRVLLIRDGSLLDQDNLKLVAQMAEEADMQVWLERVGHGPECSVIIEDGYVLIQDQQG